MRTTAEKWHTSAEARPDVLKHLDKDAEKLHKRISTLREEDLFKPFTI